MSGFFTVAIIIWVIYQLGVSLMKKGKQQTLGNFSDRLKFPNDRSIREALQGASQGSWREQIQQALQNSSRQVEEWTAHAEPFKSAKSNDIEDDYVQTEGTQGTEGTEGIEGTQGTEGTQGIEGTQGVEGTSAYEGTHRVEVNSSTDGDPGEVMPTMSGLSFSMTNRELVQGMVWAEILGKPRALHPFRGPRQS